MSGLDPVLVSIAFLARPAVLLRSAGEWSDGRWVVDASSETPISAVVHASKPEDLETLPEGERTGGMVTIWTEAALHTASEDEQTPADIIRAEDGTEYRIILAKRRDEGGFTRAMGRRIVDRGRSL